MSKTYDEVFTELDLAARANLSAHDVQVYERYKASLVADGNSPEDVELILSGFIWEGDYPLEACSN